MMDEIKKRSAWASTWVYPLITDAVSAKKAAMQGFWASVIVAAFTAIDASISIFTKHSLGPINPWSFVDVFLSAFFAWRIKSMSRVFSAIALLKYLSERIIIWPSDFNVLMMFMVLFFINGVRGTFAYHKLRKQSELAKTENDA